MININKVFQYCARELKVSIPKFRIKNMKIGIAAYSMETEEVFLSKILFRRLSRKRIDAHEKIINYTFDNI